MKLDMSEGLNEGVEEETDGGENNTPIGGAENTPPAPRSIFHLVNVQSKGKSAIQRNLWEPRRPPLRRTAEPNEYHGLELSRFGRPRDGLRAARPRAYKVAGDFMCYGDANRQK